MKNKLSISIILTFAVLLPVLTTLASTNIKASDVPTTPPTAPVINALPIFKTNSLPQARVGKFYSITITASDKNVNDQLTMNAVGLPVGLSLASCTQTVVRSTKQINCALTGVTNARGQSTVRFSVSDGIATVTKNLTLTVR